MQLSIILNAEIHSQMGFDGQMIQETVERQWAKSNVRPGCKLKQFSRFYAVAVIVIT